MMYLLEISRRSCGVYRCQEQCNVTNVTKATFMITKYWSKRNMYTNTDRQCTDTHNRHTLVLQRTTKLIQLPMKTTNIVSISAMHIACYHIACSRDHLKSIYWLALFLFLFFVQPYLEGDSGFCSQRKR